MRYAVIAPDGELAHHDDSLDWDQVIGVEGKARVRLNRSLAVTGWVNDVGLRFPKRYPRNVVGSCVLAAFGADLQPYAGPVVLTGWNPDNTPLGLTEICSLPKPVDVLDTVHGEVLKALAGQTPRELSPSWAESMREVADHVRTAPTPGLTIRAVTLP
ncbi:hypothetical protein [Streptomyces sp. NPDC056160]|uniref:hypothetical protein n=1 Tax=Streptomyces sp. NPDC056160 TaxID=3345731 RepID=UPI0035D6163E